MSLDYKVSTYRLNRPGTRNITSYGCMSSWMPRQKQRVVLPESYISRDISRRPVLPPTPLGMPSMRDVYLHRRPVRLTESLSVYRGCGSDNKQHADKLATSVNEMKYASNEDKLSTMLREGNHGGSWRHLKEVMQAAGRRMVFVDGQVASNEAILGKVNDDDATEGRPNIRRISSRSRNIAPVARYDLIDVRKGLEKYNWSILR
ncbi:hypothetical protein Btru_013963 [Bulinus truncatus]|nr:hypothetical protein Btru_013963 [Bulinus truncatus]